MGGSVIKERPFWVTAIAVILLISGFVGIVVNIFYMMEYTAISTPLNLSITALQIIFSALYIIIAMGLLCLEGHARRWGVIILTAGVIFRVVVLAIEASSGKSILESIMNIYIVIYIFFAIYLSRAKVRGAFIKTSPMPQPEEKKP